VSNNRILGSPVLVTFRTCSFAQVSWSTDLIIRPYVHKSVHQNVSDPAATTATFSPSYNLPTLQRTSGLSVLTHFPMAPGRTLYKHSRSQSVCPYASGLHSTATSETTPLSGHLPTSTTHQSSPSNRVSSPPSGLKSPSPLGGVTKEMHVDPLGTRARGRKRGKDGQEIWPIHLEEVFLQGKIEYSFCPQHFCP
jgi:hypothetical protein